MALRDDIYTELGRTTIGIVKPQNAIKNYICPCCDEIIEIGEQHVIAVPVEIPRLRRHLHSECLSSFKKYGLEIKLHPKEPDVTAYYFGFKEGS